MMAIERHVAVVRRQPLSRILACTCSLLLVFGGCGDDPTQPGTGGPPAVDSPEAIVVALADAYWTRDVSRLERLLAQEPDAEFLFHVPLPLANGRTVWDAASELYIHRRMFAPQAVPPGEPPVPEWLYPVRISVSGVVTVPFAPIANPDGLDAGRWRAFEGEYLFDVRIDTQGETDYLLVSRCVFQVIEDLSKQSGEEGRFLLYSWLEKPQEDPTTPVRASWSDIKRLFADGSAPAAPVTLIEELVRVYEARDYDSYAALFPPAPESAQFEFVLPDPLPGGQVSWDLAEELRIHRRMFRPDQVPPGETPVPQELWLVSVSVSLVSIAGFAEIENPAGLDPRRWRAWEAEYGAEVLFDTQSDTDFRATGRQRFVVAGLPNRLEGVPGKVCLYRWQESTPYGLSASETRSWSQVKRPVQVRRVRS